jgi:hypothetical protein
MLRQPQDVGRAVSRVDDCTLEDWYVYVWYPILGKKA